MVATSGGATMWNMVRAPAMMMSGAALGWAIMTYASGGFVLPLGSVLSLDAPGASSATTPAATAAPGTLWDDDVRVLLYITTHFSDRHRGFLEQCWPVAWENVQLLRKADVVVFSTGNGTENYFRKIFGKGQKVTVHRHKNEGKKDSTVGAIQRGFLHDWFVTYDWVVRVHPDVVIRDDLWLLQTMFTKGKAERVDGIFVDCRRDATALEEGRCEQGCTDSLVHTDFVAFRPNKLNRPDMLRPATEFQSPEDLLHSQVSHIILHKRDRWLPGAHPFSMDFCMVSHVDAKSPVAHYPEEVGPQACVDWFGSHGGR